MLKKSASFSSAQCARLTQQVRSEIRRTGLEVPETSNFKPSLVPPVSRSLLPFLIGWRLLTN